MVLISIIYSAAAYPERVKFITAAGKEASRHIILTANPPLVKLEGVELLVPSSSMSALKFWLFASKRTKEIVRSSDPGDPVIVHEYLSGITNFMLRFLLGRRVIRITSLYSVELKFLVRRGWRADCFSRKFFSVGQHAMWVRKSLPIAVMNVLACIGSDTIVGNSAAVTDDVKSLFPSKPTEVINTSVDVDKFHPSTLEKDKSGAVKLLFFSRINPPKGIALLLEGLRQLREEGLNFELDIIGDAWAFEQKWLDKLLRNYQASNFYNVLGKLSHDELLPYLQASDVLVFPSYYEGSPRAVKEAMAVGLACLVSDLPGATMLDVDSEALLFFKRGDLDDLKQKLRNLPGMKISGELQEISGKVREKALLFSREVVAEKQSNLYRSLLSRKNENYH
ncbi:MAG: glycosyltransferase family 4 protein [Lewinella sp.]